MEYRLLQDARDARAEEYRTQSRLLWESFREDELIQDMRDAQQTWDMKRDEAVRLFEDHLKDEEAELKEAEKRVAEGLEEVAKGTKATDRFEEMREEKKKEGTSKIPLAVREPIAEAKGEAEEKGAGQKSPPGSEGLETPEERRRKNIAAREEKALAHRRFHAQPYKESSQQWEDFNLKYDAVRFQVGNTFFMKSLWGNLFPS